MIDNGHVYNVIVDVDKIQEFIFETAKLKQMVGASVLIAYLTSRRFCLDTQILKEGENAKDLDQLTGNRWFEIYFGGGNLNLLFAQKEAAEAFLREYQLQFLKEVESASFTSIVYPLDITDFKRFKQGLEDSGIALNRRKQAKEKIVNHYANPVFKICPFCLKRSAEKETTIVDPDTHRPLNTCWDCVQKDRAQSKENLEKKYSDTLLVRFMNEYSKSPQGRPFMDNFDELKRGGEGAFLGIVTLDGNRFGENMKRYLDSRVESTASDQKVRKYVAEWHELSTRIKEKTLTAMKNTLDGDGFQEKLKPEGSGKLLFRPIIIGGDDICLVLEGRQAVPFTEKLVKNLTEAFSLYGFKFAAGAAIVKPNFPSFVAHQLSEALVKNVKKVDRQHSGLDFEVVFTSSVENLGEMRRNKYEYRLKEKDGEKHYTTTMKPYYFLEDKRKEGEGHKDFDLIIGVIKGLQNRKLLSRSKIKALREILRKGQDMSEYEFRLLIGRMSREYRQDIWRRLERIYPKGKIWKKIDGKWTNNFLDLSELGEYYPPPEDHGDRP